MHITYQFDKSCCALCSNCLTIKCRQAKFRLIYSCIQNLKHLTVNQAMKEDGYNALFYMNWCEISMYLSQGSLGKRNAVMATSETKLASLNPRAFLS